MALDDLLISTGVDQLIRLVKEKGKVEIGAAAKELRQPQRTVEDWAHVLEAEKLITIEYKLTKVYLVWHSPSSEYVAQRTEKLEAKATQAKGDIDALLSRVQQGGSDLEAIEEELHKIETTVLMTPEEAVLMKADLSSLERKYAEQAKASAEKLNRLKKKLLSLAPQMGMDSEGKPERDIDKELSVLKNFENTLQAQIDDNETFFGAFEARVEDFRKRIEEGKSDERIAELRAELAEIKSLKSELAGAMEALADEQQSLHGRVVEVEKKIEEYADNEGSISGAKKKLSELRRMAEDAHKQKEAVAEQLGDAISLVRKQASKLSAFQKRWSDSASAQKEIKDDYIDIAEEIARANEDIAQRQKDISKKLSSQMSALETLKSGGAGPVDKEEMQKVSFMLREMKREQELLAAKVKGLQKEAEIVRMESEPGQKPIRTVAAQRTQEEKEKSVAFVEKIKLSQDEENDFERKREELRSLIHRMWEESKGGAPPS